MMWYGDYGGMMGGWFGFGWVLGLLFMLGIVTLVWLGVIKLWRDVFGK